MSALEQVIEKYAPPQPREFWRTPAGMETRRWFESWGLVERERLETGDSAAVPVMAGMPGGNRSAPSNVSDVLIYHMEVDAFQRKYLTDRQRRLLRFIYCDGASYETFGLVKYTLGDGSQVEHAAGIEEPVQAVSEDRSVRAVWTYDLEDFESPELVTVAEMWNISKERLLEREHLRIGKRFAQMKVTA